MTSSLVYISIKRLGKRQPIVEKQTFSLSQSFLNTPTLKNFIKAVVEKEVNTFNEKLEDNNLLPYLDEATLVKMAQHGKVDFGDKYNRTSAILDEAVQTALQAFEDGLFMVLIDGANCKRLNQTLHFRPNSEVVFLRLVALAGGYF